MWRSMAAVFVAAVPAYAPAGAIVPVTHLAAKAQVIAIATVSTSGSRSGVFLDAAVERVLKGAVAPRRIAVRFPVRPEPVETLRDVRGVLFLRREGREWVAMPAVSGYISSVRAALILLPREPRRAALVSGTVRDRVLGEILRAHVAGKRPAGGAPVDFASEYRIDRPREALRKMYHRLADDAQTDLRAIGLRALLYDGDARAITILAQHRRRAEHDSVYDDLRDHFHSRDERSLAMLRALALDGDGPTRLQYAANIALRRITGTAAR